MCLPSTSRQGGMRTEWERRLRSTPFKSIGHDDKEDQYLANCGASGPNGDDTHSSTAPRHAASTRLLEELHDDRQLVQERGSAGSSPHSTPALPPSSSLYACLICSWHPGLEILMPVLYVQVAPTTNPS